MLKSNDLNLCLYLNSPSGEDFFDSFFLIILLNTYFSIHFSVYTQEFFVSNLTLTSFYSIAVGSSHLSQKMNYSFGF